MTNPLVITYCNSPVSGTHLRTEYFRKSLQYNEWAHVILGRGEESTELRHKIETYRNYLESHTEHDICVLSDSRNVKCLRSPTTFVETLRRRLHDKRILVSMRNFAEFSTTFHEHKQYATMTNLDQYFAAQTGSESHMGDSAKVFADQ